MKRTCRAGFPWASSPSGAILQATPLGGEATGALLGVPAVWVSRALGDQTQLQWQRLLPLLVRSRGCCSRGTCCGSRGRGAFSGLFLENSVNCSTRSLPTVFASQVSQAVQWLVSHCPSALDLCCQTLIQYVEDGVSREFSGRFFHDRRERRLGGLAPQEPSAVIELFNSVLSFLASVVSSAQLCDLSWPVTEFAEAGGSRLLPHLHWNTPEHLAWLRQAVLGFQLPQMDLPPPGGACSC